MTMKSRRASRDVLGPAPIAGAFLVTFDDKAGYTIAWSAVIDGLELESSVEYKSLPSGSHNVSEDVIYFQHDLTHLGVSAFINQASENASRHATLLAVGIVLSAGYQLGDAWLYVVELRQLARSLAMDTKEDYSKLRDFWEKYRSGEATERYDDPVSSGSRSRTKHTPDNSMPQSRIDQKPARPLGPSVEASCLRLTNLTSTFGPLAFLLHRLALLRKRILLVGNAPVEETCKIVHHLAVISALPEDTHEILPLQPLPIAIRPLYSIGIRDIPYLESFMSSQADVHDQEVEDAGHSFSNGYIACTTDRILAQRPKLYDYVVYMPEQNKNPSSKAEKMWPKVMRSDGSSVFATHRDLRRYRLLQSETATLRQSLLQAAFKSTDHDSPVENESVEAIGGQEEANETNVVEAKPWPLVAWEGIMWWAAAGEKHIELDEEDELDIHILRRFDPDSILAEHRRLKDGLSHGSMANALAEAKLSPDAFAPLILDYFRHLTSLMLTTISHTIEEYDDQSCSEDEQDERPLVRRSSRESHRAEQRSPKSPHGNTDSNDYASTAENADFLIVEAADIKRAGLDPWSETDRGVVKELIDLYWGRYARINAARHECCGISII